MGTLNGMLTTLISSVGLLLDDLTLSLRAVDRVVYWVIRLLYYLAADDGTLATRLLDCFQF